MDKRQWTYWLIGLGVALVLAVCLSPFASSAPDGLERVAEEKGFAEKGEGPVAWSWAPLPDYGVAGEEGWWPTCAAGAVGTLGVFAAAFGLGKLLARRSPGERQGTRKKEQGTGRQEGTNAVARG
jgi:cobalt/nickel transport protein